MGACRICAARTEQGYSLCTSCRDVALALRRPPAPVTPVALVTSTSPLYRALRQYKSGEPGVAARQGERLGSLLERFFARHARCIAPGGVDVAVVVPSGHRGRPPPHPLAGVVARAASLPPLAEVLAPGDLAVAHRRPSPQAYRASAEVRGARVLLVDDVYTSGAHLQSAAACLSDAGARAVHPVVLGRYVREAAAPPTCGCARS